jgi:predicted aspartyl protease
MVFTRYYSGCTPPAPFVNVDLVHPSNPAATAQKSAQVDSGADRTLIPEDVAKQLGLLRVGDVQILGITGAVQTVSLFQVKLLIGPYAITLKVATHTADQFVVLGRDVLNLFYLRLNGPDQTLSIATQP